MYVRCSNTLRTYNDVLLVNTGTHTDMNTAMFYSRHIDVRQDYLQIIEINQRALSVSAHQVR